MAGVYTQKLGRTQVSFGAFRQAKQECLAATWRSMRFPFAGSWLTSTAELQFAGRGLCLLAIGFPDFEKPQGWN
jgi:hypothetical protein